MREKGRKARGNGRKRGKGKLCIYIYINTEREGGKKDGEWEHLLATITSA